MNVPSNASSAALSVVGAAETVVLLLPASLPLSLTGVIPAFGCVFFPVSANWGYVGRPTS